MSSNKLVLIGSGIKSLSHLTEEAKAYIKQADHVLYLVNEPVAKAYIEQQSVSSESLEPIYFKHADRRKAYSELSTHITSELSKYKVMAVVMYGHPTVFAAPGLSAIRQAQEHGIETLIVPGISAEDCLFADLAIDPGAVGCMSLEATEFLTKKRLLDNQCHVILWQVAMLGSLTHESSEDLSQLLTMFREKLLTYYDRDDIAYVYEAAIYPGFKPKVTQFKLNHLHKQDFTSLSTLYIPPNTTAQLDQDIVAKLRLENK